MHRQHRYRYSLITQKAARGSEHSRLPLNFFRVCDCTTLVTVLMMQVPQAINVPYWRQTRTLVYQALMN